jgi:hypothetical protein
MPIVLKSGSLKLLEPSGSVKACNGIALPFTVMVMSTLEQDTKAKRGSRVTVLLFLYLRRLIMEVGVGLRPV